MPYLYLTGKMSERLSAHPSCLSDYRALRRHTHYFPLQYSALQAKKFRHGLRFRTLLAFQRFQPCCILMLGVSKAALYRTIYL